MFNHLKPETKTSGPLKGVAKSKECVAMRVLLNLTAKFKRKMLQHKFGATRHKNQSFTHRRV